MANILQVKFKIYSHIDNLDDAGLPEGDSEITETSFFGTLDRSSEKTLTYEEKGEDGSTVLCTVCECDGCVRVTRTGAIFSQMVFEEGVTHSSVYKIPPYAFDMKITAKRIRGELLPGKDLVLIYSMEIGGAKKACRMRISITNTEARTL